MFNPAYVLPTFLGVCCAGLVIWNVKMTGDVENLEIKLDRSLDDNEMYEQKVEKLLFALDKKDTTIRSYQQDVDTLREERRIQEQKIENCLAAEAEYIQKILDLETKLKDSHAISNGTFNSLMAEVRGFQQKIEDQEKTIKDFTGMINTLNNKIPKRDKSGKFKKKK